MGIQFNSIDEKKLAILFAFFLNFNFDEGVMCFKDNTQKININTKGIIGPEYRLQKNYEDLKCIDLIWKVILEAEDEAIVQRTTDQLC